MYAQTFKKVGMADQKLMAKIEKKEDEGVKTVGMNA